MTGATVVPKRPTKPQPAAEQALAYLEAARASIMARLRRIAAPFPAPPDRVAVVGGGTMGSGIAFAIARSGIVVELIERDASSAASAGVQIERLRNRQLAAGRIDHLAAAQIQKLLTVSYDLERAASCSLIIEAVTEDPAIKSALLRRLASLLPAETVVASNTSYLGIDDLAQVYGRPDVVLGLHFFSPAHANPLVELVPGRMSSPSAVARCARLALQIGKLAVPVGNAPGFVANRMMAARSTQIEDILLNGVTPARVDRAHLAYGWKMGPLAAADLAGLDVSWRHRQSAGLTAPVADRLCIAGRFGQKAGCGYFRYAAGSTEPLDDPQANNLVAATAEKLAVAARDWTDTEIVTATASALASAGRAIVTAGLVTEPADIDVIWTEGFGFPVWRGGPLYAAQAEMAQGRSSNIEEGRPT